MQEYLFDYERSPEEEARISLEAIDDASVAMGATISAEVAQELATRRRKLLDEIAEAQKKAYLNSNE